MEIPTRCILFAKLFYNGNKYWDPSRRPKAGVNRIKKADLKIDMTPMVDLGFLLISFFIFTTEISKPAITNLYMPKDGDPTKIPGSRSLTILLGDNDHAFYYNGDMNQAIKNNQVFQTSYDEINGIGNIIRQRQNELKNRNIEKKDVVILIKPGRSSSYKNVINTLDEMLINGVSRYMITDLEKEEITCLEQLNHNH
jgi:biopolymer transport protein ExbD